MKNFFKETKTKERNENVLLRIELLCNVNGNVNELQTLCGKQFGVSSKKLNIYDPAIPVLGIYPKEWKSVSRRDIRPPMFIAALFIIVKR